MSQFDKMNRVQKRISRSLSLQIYYAWVMSQTHPKELLDYMKSLLIPSKGTDDQEIINLANPDFGATGGDPTQSDIETYWNPYIQPIWTQLHNQLLNQMLEVNAMLLGNSNQYLTSSEWQTSGSPPVYASSSWPYRVTPTWMQTKLQPSKTDS